MSNEVIALLPYEVQRVSLKLVSFSEVPQHVRPYRFPDDESLPNAWPVDDVTWFKRYGQLRQIHCRSIRSRKAAMNALGAEVHT